MKSAGEFSLKEAKTIWKREMGGKRIEEEKKKERKVQRELKWKKCCLYKQYNKPE